VGVSQDTRRVDPDVLRRMKHIKLKGTKTTHKIFDPYEGVTKDALKQLSSPVDFARFKDSDDEGMHIVPEFARDRPMKVFKCRDCKATVQDGAAIAKLTPIDGKLQCWTCYSQYWQSKALGKYAWQDGFDDIRYKFMLLLDQQWIDRFDFDIDDSGTVQILPHGIVRLCQELGPQTRDMDTSFWEWYQNIHYLDMPAVKTFRSGMDMDTTLIGSTLPDIVRLFRNGRIKQEFDRYRAEITSKIPQIHAEIKKLVLMPKRGRGEVMESRKIHELKKSGRLVTSPGRRKIKLDEEE